MIMAQTLLDAAYQAEARQIDEKIFLEVFAPEPPAEARAGRKQKAA